MTDKQSASSVRPEASNTDSEWYYVSNGARNGPVAATVIGELIARKQLDSTDLVWRSGLADWQMIRESDLGFIVSNEPPPLSAANVSNAIVWVLAFLPLILGFVEVGMALDFNSKNDPFGFRSPAGKPYEGPEVHYRLYFFSYILMSGIDLERVRRAGYRLGWKTAILALFVTPVYLFLRAKKLKQRPTYAIAWIVFSILSAIMVVAARG
jgi:hypothetical protein